MAGSFDLLKQIDMLYNLLLFSCYKNGCVLLKRVVKMENMASELHESVRSQIVILSKNRISQHHIIARRYLNVSKCVSV